MVHTREMTSRGGPRGPPLIMPSRSIVSAGCPTPSQTSAVLALFVPCLAFAIHHCLTEATACYDRRNQAVRWNRRYPSHSLRRCRNGQRKSGNSEEPDHFLFSLRFSFTTKPRPLQRRPMFLIGIGRPARNKPHTPGST